MTLIGYRKFILAILSLVSATGLVAFERIGEGTYAAVIVATVGAFITANVVQKVMDK